MGGPLAESSANAFDAIEKLRRVYCSTTGFDYSHVFVPEERDWLRHAAESGRFLPPMDAASAAALLNRITQVDVFERFLHRTFPARRASRSRARHARADPRRDHLRRRQPGRAPDGHRHGAPRPAERPRAHSQKPYAQILAEFKDPVAQRTLRLDLGWMGDVKYHAGASAAAPVGQITSRCPRIPAIWRR